MTETIHENLASAVETLHKLLETNPKFAQGIYEAAGYDISQKAGSEVTTDGRSKSSIEQQPDISIDKIVSGFTAILDLREKLGEIDPKDPIQNLMHKSFKKVLEFPQGAIEQSISGAAKALLEPQEIKSLTDKNATVQDAVTAIDQSHTLEVLRQAYKNLRELNELRREEQEKSEPEQENNTKMITALGEAFGVIDTLVKSIKKRGAEGLDTTHEKDNVKKSPIDTGIEDVKLGAALKAPDGVAAIQSKDRSR